MKNFPLEVELVDTNKLVARGTITQEDYDHLVNCLKQGKKLLIAGATGSGKSTLLSALVQGVGAVGLQALDELKDEYNYAQIFKASNTMKKLIDYTIPSVVTMNSSSPEETLTKLEQFRAVTPIEEGDLNHFDVLVHMTKLTDGTCRVTNISRYPSDKELHDLQTFIRENLQEDLGDWERD